MSFEKYLKSLSGKRVSVVGAGVSNTPLIEALLFAGIDTTVCDKRPRDKMEDTANHFQHLGAKLCLGENYLDNLNADIIFRTPGLMPSHPMLQKAVAGGSLLTSEMEVFFDICPCKTIGVTGSDGKTTTTSIIAEILKNQGETVHLGGNIGTPLLCSVDDIQKDDIAVLELSSFQLISMRKSPEIAILTNLSPNHLDVHSCMQEYADAKRNIFLHQHSKDRIVFNRDNEYTPDYEKDVKADEVFYFSGAAPKGKIQNGARLENGIIYLINNGREEKLMEAQDIRLPGAHNVENYMAAFVALRGLASKDAMIDTARSFCGVEHRLEAVRQHNGIQYYNDSIASSPSRTIAGLRSFDQKVILIAGGKDKGVPYDEIGPVIIEKVKTLILTGMSAETIRVAVLNTPGHSGTPNIIMQDDFKEAVLTASKVAESGDIVLLSPASTSFDCFADFAQRGEYFKEIVRGLQ